LFIICRSEQWTPPSPAPSTAGGLESQLSPPQVVREEIVTDTPQAQAPPAHSLGIVSDLFT